MTRDEAEKLAMKLSKNDKTAYIVWVHGEGRQVYDEKQITIWRPFVQIEEMYLDGELTPS